MVVDAVANGVVSEEEDSFDTGYEYKANTQVPCEEEGNKQKHKPQSTIRTRKVKAIFYKADSDASGQGSKADGVLDQEELKIMLTQICGTHGEQFADEIFRNMDADGDGTVSFQEMYAYFRSLMDKKQEKESGITKEVKIGGSMANPDKEGVLSKQGHNLMKDWNNRYIAIKEGILCYYNNHEDFKKDKPLGRFEMKFAALNEDPALIKDLRLELTCSLSKKTYHFRDTSEASLAQWKAAIQTAIQMGLGFDRTQKDGRMCSALDVQAVDHVKKQRKQKMNRFAKMFSVSKDDASMDAPTVSGLSLVEDKLVELFDEQSVDEMEDLLQTRWCDFVNFKRLGADNTEVMTSNDSASDALPGNYRLNSLIRDQFDMKTTFVAPPHAVVKGVRWEQKTASQKYGRIVVPPGAWDGTIPVGFGTNQNLSYYGASLVDEDREDLVSLVYRHVTTDFTYGDDYYGKYVAALAGGAGLERHEFHHIECPLSDDSGHFVLAKFTGDDEIHISGFIIPKNHIIHIPNNVIHSNDHMRGTWRTMLSDGPDIDLVKFYTETKDVMEDGLLKSITWDRLDAKTKWGESAE